MCRTFYRKPIENRWIQDGIFRLIETPWSLTSCADSETRPIAAKPKKEQLANNDMTPVPKAWKIGYADLMEHGFAEGCEQCFRNEICGKSKDGMSHTSKCTKRLFENHMKTFHGRARMEAYAGRVDQSLKDRMNITAADTADGMREARPEFAELVPGEASSSSGLLRDANEQEVATQTPIQPTNVETAVGSLQRPSETTPDAFDDSNGQALGA